MKQVLQNIGRFFFPPKIEKKTIHAIHEYDIEDFLNKLDSKDKLRNEEILCSFCNTVLTADNLECIISFGGELKFCCNKPDCYNEALKISQIIAGKE